MKARKRGKTGKRATALDRLLTEAQRAMQHQISSRRKAVEGDGTWPTTQEATDLLERLARTSGDQREAFRQRLSHRQRAVLGIYGGYSVKKALSERSRDRLRLGLVSDALGSGNEDWRDWMLGVDHFHYAAGRLGMRPADLFDEAAGYAPKDMVTLFQRFGRRTDITADFWPGVYWLVQWENGQGGQ